MYFNTDWSCLKRHVVDFLLRLYDNSGKYNLMRWKGVEGVGGKSGLKYIGYIGYINRIFVLFDRIFNY